MSSVRNVTLGMAATVKKKKELTLKTYILGRRGKKRL